MKLLIDRKEELRNMLDVKKIANMCEIKSVLCTKARVTAARTLQRLKCLTSYSHRGAYYTLPGVPAFDAEGLWIYKGVGFSRIGNLRKTSQHFVEKSSSGFTALELDHKLQVETKHTLLHLVRSKLLNRFLMGREYVYVSIHDANSKRQKMERKHQQAKTDVGMGIQSEMLPDEMKEAIILFFSLLDEKQRRLYAGLESAKIGHGGDVMLANLLNVDPHTVAKGRRELLDRNVLNEGVRRKGGGNKPLKKKA